jgi:hypothetical protein
LKEDKRRENLIPNLKRINSNNFSISEIDREIQKLTEEYRALYPEKIEFTSTYSKWS